MLKRRHFAGARSRSAGEQPSLQGEADDADLAAIGLDLERLCAVNVWSETSESVCTSSRSERVQMPDVWPPSTNRACPVVNPESSEQRNSTAAAISSGLPIRPIGSKAIMFAMPSGVSPVKRDIIEVSVMPGHIAFTRMFDFAYSSAATLLTDITPHFEAQ
jgi:hypothetical protein